MSEQLATENTFKHIENLITLHLQGNKTDQIEKTMSHYLESNLSEDQKANADEITSSISAVIDRIDHNLKAIHQYEEDGKDKTVWLMDQVKNLSKDYKISEDQILKDLNLQVLDQDQDQDQYNVNEDKSTREQISKTTVAHQVNDLSSMLKLGALDHLSDTVSTVETVFNNSSKNMIKNINERSRNWLNQQLKDGLNTNPIPKSDHALSKIVSTALHVSQNQKELPIDLQKMESPQITGFASGIVKKIEVFNAVKENMINAPKAIEIVSQHYVATAEAIIKNKCESTGGWIGAKAGAFIGAFFSPALVPIGSTIGSMIGQKVGGWVADQVIPVAKKMSKEIKNIAVSLANKVSSQVKSIAKSLSKAVKFC
jgi:hypothetical protein